MSKNLFLVTTVFLITVFFFQNCSQQFEATVESSSKLSTTLEVGTDHFAPQGDLFKTSVRATYLNRIQVANTLVSVFGNSVSNEVIERVGWSYSEFGSSYGVYNRVNIDASCDTNRSSLYVCNNQTFTYGTNDVVGASAPREGRRSFACHIGVSDNDGLEHAFKKIKSDATLDSPPQVTEENFQRVFQLFFRGKPYPGPAFSDALNLTFHNVKDPRGAWEKVILGICLSPHWQVL